MGDDFVAYIERLQLMAFFSGYAFIYLIVHIVAGEKSKDPVAFLNRAVRLLPLAYALTGTLFLGYILKNMFPDYALKNFSDQFQAPYLKIVGLLSVLFWIPTFRKKPVFSLLHSLVFFFFLLKDLYMYIAFSTGNDAIKNDMKVFTDSILLNTGTLAVMVIIYFVIRRIRSRSAMGNWQ
jgi:hypothetical protein